MDGTFVDATPMEGGILVNIGLMLENWTNGLLRATRHRILRPMREERVSVIYFPVPGDDVVIEPIRRLKPETDPSLYGPISGAQQNQILFDYVQSLIEEQKQVQQ